MSDDTDRFLLTHQMKVADSFQALLSDPCVKAIVLATPHSLHAQQVAAAARAGKHVFCEKPLVMSAEAWRAQREETPCGGLTPMGVHAIDGMIDTATTRRPCSFG